MTQTALGSGTGDTLPAGKGQGDDSGSTGKLSDSCPVCGKEITNVLSYNINQFHILIVNTEEIKHFLPQA